VSLTLEPRQATGEPLLIAADAADHEDDIDGRFFADPGI
jgi:hypothetical protein